MLLKLKTLQTQFQKTKLVWIESPTNPTLKISDIEAISKVAKV